MTKFLAAALKRSFFLSKCRRPLILSAVICFAAFGPAAIAAEPGNDTAIAAIHPRISELVGLVTNGRVDAMLDRIGPIVESDRPAFEATRAYLIRLYGNAGKSDGWDFAGFKSLTPRYYEVYVVVYFEKRPVLFDFGFYFFDNAWRPQTFRVESDFKAVLDTMPLQK